MSATRTNTRALLPLACWLAVSTNVWGQETLTRAKDLYASAAYEEALAVIDRLHETAPADDAFEIAGYRIFCLLALDRSDEARREIQLIVRANPLYRLSNAQASPRTRALFDEERRQLLPEIVRQTYAVAKTALDRKETPAALEGFDRVLLILEEPGLTSQPGLGDMRTLATGFRDLIKLSLAAPAPPAANAPTTIPSTERTSTAPAAAPPEAPRMYGFGDTAVVPPVAVNQVVPAWHPPAGMAWFERRATLELVIDETGTVTSAVLKKGLHPSYDAILLSAAHRWTFRPATRDGVPVRYRKLIEIVLNPNQSRRS
jgi:tetratricopeptide (TPR) repeat protein